MTDELKLLLDRWGFVNSERVCDCGHHRRDHIHSHGQCCPDSPCRDEDCPCDDYRQGHVSRGDVAHLIAAVEAALAEHPTLRLGCIIHLGRSDCECEPLIICAKCAVTHPCPSVAAIRAALIGEDNE